MPVLNLFSERYQNDKPFEGMNINICLHIEAKTGCLALALKNLGGPTWLWRPAILCQPKMMLPPLWWNAVSMCLGIHGADEALYDECITRSLENHPQLIIDDGGDLVHILHTTRRELIPILSAVVKRQLRG